jgi:hypothetical protein
MDLRDFLGKGIQEVIATEDSLCDAILSCKTSTPEINVIVVRGRKMLTLDQAFDELAAALQLPYYFGYNWAALDECINDQDWMPFGKCIVVVSDADKLFGEERAAENQLKVFMDILRRASHDWESGVNGRKMQFSCVFTTSQALSRPTSN